MTAAAITRAEPRSRSMIRRALLTSTQLHGLNVLRSPVGTTSRSSQISHSKWEVFIVSVSWLPVWIDGRDDF